MARGEEQVSTADGGLSGIDVVLDYFNRILAADDGSLSFVRREGDALVLHYRQGTNEDCPTCVFTPEDLTALVLEATQKRDASIVSVQLL